MMDTLRSSCKVASAAVMNSELVYSFLIGIGWFFLMGWMVALVVACMSAFREDPTQLARLSAKGAGKNLTGSSR
jgi:hypothetical protein